MPASFGLGMAALGRPGYINLGHADDLKQKYSIGAMRARAHQMLDLAWELGIRHFDVARSYGRAEEFLGSWIMARQIKPDSITVSSKWGYTYTAAWRVQTPEGVQHEIKRHTLEVLQSQYGSSLKLLGTHLSLYQIHSANLASGVLENLPVLEMLNKIKNAGIAVGISVSGTDQSETIKRALAIEFDGQPLFSSIQATWNLLERAAESALELAHQQGRHVIVKECLANGRLTTRNVETDFADRMGILQSAAQELGASVDAVALAAAVHQPWAGTVLSGAVTEEHLRSNLLAKEIPWSQSLAGQLDKLKESSDDYWQSRSRLPWN